MEHPLINDIDHLSIDELQDRITDLTKKLSWAQRSGNVHLRSQIQMALTTFMTKYQEKQDAAWAASRKNGPDFSDKIDIS